MKVGRIIEIFLLLLYAIIPGCTSKETVNRGVAQPARVEVSQAGVHILYSENSAVDTTKGRMLLDLSRPETLDPTEAMKFTLVSEPPRFPQEGAVGTVSIAMLVDQAGDVVKAAILTTDNPALNRASLEAVMKWKFRPEFAGSERGRWGKTMFIFKLDR